MERNEATEIYWLAFNGELVGELGEQYSVTTLVARHYLIYTHTIYYTLSHFRDHEWETALFLFKHFNTFDMYTLLGFFFGGGGEG